MNRWGAALRNQGLTRLALRVMAETYLEQRFSLECRRVPGISTVFERFPRFRFRIPDPRGRAEWKDIIKRLDPRSASLYVRYVRIQDPREHPAWRGVTTFFVLDPCHIFEDPFAPGVWWATWDILRRKERDRLERALAPGDRELGLPVGPNRLWVFGCAQLAGTKGEALARHIENQQPRNSIGAEDAAALQIVTSTPGRPRGCHPETDKRIQLAAALSLLGWTKARMAPRLYPDQRIPGLAHSATRELFHRHGDRIEEARSEMSRSRARRLEAALTSGDPRPTRTA